MKDQYFGDINDYRKYGLLRTIIGVTGLSPLIAWMLTPDDLSTDGQFISYLEDPGKWSRHDPVLFQKLKALLSSGEKRRVSLIENTDLLRKTRYFSSLVPETASGRGKWFTQLVQRGQECDFVFLDPDNGMEIKSRAYGRKGSSKYLYWHEVEAIWKSGKSMLIYQHFIREKRPVFVQRMLENLREVTPGSFIEAFSTPNVVFLMALQPLHREFHQAIVDSVQGKWKGQIQHWELTCAQQGAPADRKPDSRSYR